jgi:hypothetical protein
MKHIRIERPKVRRQRPWHEALPLDPRDPDILRAKTLGRSAHPPTADPQRSNTARTPGRQACHQT